MWPTSTASALLLALVQALVQALVLVLALVLAQVLVQAQVQALVQALVQVQVQVQQVQQVLATVRNPPEAAEVRVALPATLSAPSGARPLETVKAGKRGLRMLSLSPAVR